MNEVVEAEFEEKEVPRTREEIIKDMEEVIDNFSIPQKREFDRSDKIRLRIREKESKYDGSPQQEQSIENDKRIYTGIMRNLGLLQYFTELDEIGDEDVISD